MSSTGSPITSKGGIAFPRESQSPASRTSPQSATMLQSSVLAAAAGMDTPVDDNPPPWLWPNVWNWNDTDATATVAPTDDVEVNMDEDFDWQDWQQSVRGFQLDAGLGTGLTGQGPGFSSGL
jgi:hypothetical protein